MSNVIASVDALSPAQRAGIQPGDRLMMVNGNEIVDVLDYQYYTYDRKLHLTLETKGGRKRTVRIRKEDGEDLGLNFETYLMDRKKSCANRCVFCFVDQLPKGMRSSLYFKDDDARLSFLMGNYITLTNLTQRELQRIIDLKISPLNLSIHSTDPQLRSFLLGNPRGGESLLWVEKFAKAGIIMNCQVVACPGLNDGPALLQTMEDLSRLYPAVPSVSIVPVGLTGFREGLYPLSPYTKEQAAAVVNQVEAYGETCKERYGSAIFFCSDEFYLIAGRDLPEDPYYEGYPQLENGVGMLRLLLTELEEAALALWEEGAKAAASPFSIVTGRSAGPFLQRCIDRARETWHTVDGKVYPVENDFFGRTIVVAGLVTGRDLVAQLRGKDLGERLLLPVNMLRHGEGVFLDDMTLAQVSEALGVPVFPVNQDGGELLRAMLGIGE
jgi:putative radical SAM enzyme (TIGR03279 family)